MCVCAWLLSILPENHLHVQRESAKDAQHCHKASEERFRQGSLVERAFSSSGSQILCRLRAVLFRIRNFAGQQRDTSATPEHKKVSLPKTALEAAASLW